jgi:hypothetical protein
MLTKEKKKEILKNLLSSEIVEDNNYESFVDYAYHIIEECNLNTLNFQTCHSYENLDIDLICACGYKTKLYCRNYNTHKPSILGIFESNSKHFFLLCENIKEKYNKIIKEELNRVNSSQLVLEKKLYNNLINSIEI